MKKSSKFFAGAVCFLSALTFSCNNISTLTIPKKVSVSSNAQYYVNLGSFEYNLSEKLSMDSLKETMQSTLGEKVSIYDYEVADDDTLSYVIRYPMFDFPLDVGSSLSGLNFDGVFDSVKDAVAIDKTVLIDESVTHFENSMTQDVDIMSQLTSDDASQELTVPIQEADGNLASIMGALGDKDKLEVTSAAEHVIYAAGSTIQVAVTAPADSKGGDFSVKLKISILDSNTAEANVIAASDEVDVTDGGTAVLNIGKDKIPDGLPKTYYIAFEGEVTGSNEAWHSYDFDMGYGPDTDIEKVVDISASEIGGNPTYTLDSIEIDLATAQEIFDSAKIKEGFISFEAVIPEGWTDITANTTVSISGAGLSYDENDFTDNSSVSGKLLDEYLDLAGGNLDFSSDSKLTINITVEFDVDGGDIDFTQSDRQEIDIKYEAQISKLGDLEIDITKLGVEASNDFSQSGAVKKEMLNFIKQVTFGSESGGKYYKHTDSNTVGTEEGNGLGFKCNVYNNLDLKDDLEISIKSDVLNYDYTATIPGSMAAEESQNWVSYNTIDFTTLPNDSDHDLDFKVTLPTTISVDEFEIGKEYTISLSMEEMYFDWDTATLDTSNLSKQGNVDMGGFSFHSLLGSFLGEDASKIQMQTFPVFLYNQKPDDTVDSALADLISDISLSGKITMEYDLDGDAVTDYFLGSKDATASVEFLDLISWPSSDEAINADDDFAKTYLTEDGGIYSHYEDIVDAMNSNSSGLTFNYDITVSNGGSNDLTVCKSMIDGIEDSDSINIKIETAIILKLALNLKDDISIDLMSMFNEEYNTADDEGNYSDLLGRESADSLANFAQVADSISYFAIEYKFTNQIFDGLDVSASVSDEVTGINNEITLSTTKVNTFKLTGAQIRSMLTNYPFHPNILFNIGGGTVNPSLAYDAETNPYKTLVIKRSAMENETATVGISPAMRLKFNKDVPYEFVLPVFAE